MVKHQYYLTTNEKHIFKNTRFGGAEPSINMGTSHIVSITNAIFGFCINDFTFGYCD